MAETPPYYCPTCGIPDGHTYGCTANRYATAGQLTQIQAALTAAEQRAEAAAAQRDIVLRKCAQELRDKAEQLRRKTQDTGAWEWAARLLERFAEQWERDSSEKPMKPEGCKSGSDIETGATTQDRWRDSRAAGRFLRDSMGVLLLKCGSAETAAELAAALAERDALRAENARLAAELREAQAALGITQDGERQPLSAEVARAMAHFYTKLAERIDAERAPAEPAARHEEN